MKIRKLFLLSFLALSIMMMTSSNAIAESNTEVYIEYVSAPITIDDPRYCGPVHGDCSATPYYPPGAGGLPCTMGGACIMSIPTPVNDISMDNLFLSNMPQLD
ncbi:MAG: hypothetical protein GPJ54_07040 [Candidatus Heimdallarchaeota archaeon]|nr:hypothetical protein [Candidatus Heimdallarchaeota archaeon]